MGRYTSPYDQQPMCEQTIPSILENRAAHLGDDPYLYYDRNDRELSFADTDERANAIANSLSATGVGPGERVSVMLRNPLQTMLAMFGINKAGAVYSPINYDYEGSVLSYQLDDTHPSLLIVEDSYVGRLNEIVDDLEQLPTVAVFETDAESESLDDAFDARSYNAFLRGDTTRPAVDVSWHDTASIVYTSGTTGKPKGVVLPHRWIFANYVAPSPPRENGVAHCPLPLYHVGGLYASNVSALVSGSAVSLWDRFSPTDFWDRVEKYEATSTVLISVMMSWLMDQPERDNDQENTISYVSMTPLPDNYDEIAERFGFDLVSTGFGQTESGNPLSALIHAAHGEHATPEACRRISVERVIEQARERGLPVVEEAPDSRYMGTPKPGLEVTIVDGHDEELPPGEVGELAVRSKESGLLMKEYYGKPEATVEAFGNLWFHTGDAAYRDEENNFYFVDRLGDVIRRRGENISSMQIQETALEHDGVAGAAAFPVPASEGGEDEIGLVVEPTDDADLSKTDVRHALKTRLPELMVPKHVAVTDRIPTTETNKMEKYRLREEFFEPS